MRLRAGLMALLLAAATAAHAHEASGAAGTGKTIELPAREFHEECLELTTRQRLQYAFRSAQPLDFNIHYHRGNDVFYPVRQKNVRAHNNTFVPRRNDGYCLMWTNATQASITLEYRFSVQPAAAKK